MLGLDQTANLLVADAGEDPWRQFQHRRRDAELRRGRGDFQPDQAGADDEQPARLAKFHRQSLRVGLGSEVVHVGHADGQVRQFADERPRRDHQRVVGQPAAVFEHQRSGIAIDRLTARVALEHHAVRGEAAGTGNRRVRRQHFADEDAFRERGFFVRLAGFFGEQDDAGVRVLLFRRDCREGAGRSSADHQDGPGRLHPLSLFRRGGRSSCRRHSRRCWR